MEPPTHEPASPARIGAVLRPRQPWLRLGVPALTLLLAAKVASALDVTPPTAGFVLLTVVVFAATWGGVFAGIGASFAAATCFSFFLPPLGDPPAADADNWVALVVFVGSSILTSRLVTRARDQAERAEARAREVEAVSALTVHLLAPERDPPSLGRAAGDALLAIGARAAGVVVYENDVARLLTWCGGECAEDTLERALAFRRSIATVGIGDGVERDYFVPLRVRDEPIGVLASLGTRATESAVESVAKVLTLALERERLLRERFHVEAVRESEALKTALLRAVSHDLSTPLTAIGFHVDALKRKIADEGALTNVEALGIEASRLRRRVEDLLALGRLEAGHVKPRPEPVPAADLFRAARESLSLLRRPLKVRIDSDCPDLWADPSLALEIVVNLLENADRASSDGTAVELVASPVDGRVRLGVLDRGRGFETARPGQEIEPGDVLPRGLGLEIARRFASASGGGVKLESRVGGGVAAWVMLPATPLEAGV